MVGHSLAGEAFGWLTNCPARVQTEQPVPLALVDCYLAKKDWGGLETFLEAQKWGDLEFLRFAFLSRAAAEQNQKLAVESRWRSAVREATDRFARRFGHMEETLQAEGRTVSSASPEELERLWQAAKRVPGIDTPDSVE